MAALILALVLQVAVLNPSIEESQSELSGVRHAGPCRSEGIKDTECRRQARLIFAACADQPQHCAQVYGIKVVITKPGSHHIGAVYPGIITAPTPAAIPTVNPPSPTPAADVGEHHAVQPPEHHESPPSPPRFEPPPPLSPAVPVLSPPEEPKDEMPIVEVRIPECLVPKKILEICP